MDELSPHGKPVDSYPPTKAVTAVAEAPARVLPQVNDQSKGSGPNALNTKVVQDPIAKVRGVSLGSSPNNQGSSPVKYCLELMGGSCRITRAWARKGFEAFGVDHKGNISTPEAPCINLDLRERWNQNYVLDLLRRSLVGFICMPPPCGTASRAREKANPVALKRKGMKRPLPLRSEDHPMGLPGLSHSDKTKVDAANELYEFCVLVATIADEVGCL